MIVYFILLCIIFGGIVILFNDSGEPLWKILLSILCGCSVIFLIYFGTFWLIDKYVLKDNINYILKFIIHVCIGIWAILDGIQNLRNLLKIEDDKKDGLIVTTEEENKVDKFSIFLEGFKIILGAYIILNLFNA